jgi:hypothetical protein
VDLQIGHAGTVPGERAEDGKAVGRVQLIGAGDVCLIDLGNLIGGRVDDALPEDLIAGPVGIVWSARSIGDEDRHRQRLEHLEESSLTFAEGSFRLSTPDNAAIRHQARKGHQ